MELTNELLKLQREMREMWTDSATTDEGYVTVRQPNGDRHLVPAHALITLALAAPSEGERKLMEVGQAFIDKFEHLLDSGWDGTLMLASGSHVCDLAREYLAMTPEPVEPDRDMLLRYLHPDGVEVNKRKAKFLHWLRRGGRNTQVTANGESLAFYVFGGREEVRFSVAEIEAWLAHPCPAPANDRRGEFLEWAADYNCGEATARFYSKSGEMLFKKASRRATFHMSEIESLVAAPGPQESEADPTPALTAEQEAAMNLGRVAYEEAELLESRAHCFSMVNDAGDAWDCSAKLNEAICEYRAAIGAPAPVVDERRAEFLRLMRDPGCRWGINEATGNLFFARSEADEWEALFPQVEIERFVEHAPTPAEAELQKAQIELAKFAESWANGPGGGKIPFEFRVLVNKVRALRPKAEPTPAERAKAILNEDPFADNGDTSKLLVLLRNSPDLVEHDGRLVPVEAKGEK